MMEGIDTGEDWKLFNVNYWGNKKDIKDFEKLKVKKLCRLADIKFLKDCLKEDISPNFVKRYIKPQKGNNSIQDNLERKVIDLEINNHYKTVNELDVKLYEIHLKILKYCSCEFLINLQRNTDERIYHRYQSKIKKLNDKFRKLKDTQKGNFDDRGCNKVRKMKPGHFVKNLSSKTFDKKELELLDKGLNTCIDVPKKLDEYVADIEVAIFDKPEKEKIVARKRCEDILKKLKESSKDRYIYHNQVKSLNEKSNEVVYTKADKGNNIVILDKVDYEGRMNNLLENGNFKEMDGNPLNRCMKEYNQGLKKIKLILNDKEKMRLKPDNPTLPRIYGLPKIHKPGDKMRPIINNIGAPIYKISKWLCDKFKNLECFESRNILNSLELVEKVKNVQLSKNDRLVSFDVESLFPSIPKDKVLLALEKWLLDINMNKDEVKEYVELTKLCINQNYCVFRGRFFKMEQGLAMGNPLSPFLANLFMSSFEIQMTKAFPQIFKVWYRYVDDIFAIVNENLIDDAKKLLNIQDKAIKFTVEVENHCKLPFLDLWIIRKDGKLEFGIYRKETHVDNYIKNGGFNPKQHKHAVLNSLVCRLINIPLSIVEFEKEYKHIVNVAVINGFNKKLVDKKIQKFKRKQWLKNKTTLGDNKEKKVYKKITFHPWAFNRFKKIFKEIKIELAPVNKCKIKNLVNFDNKDKISANDKSGIYEIKCDDCDRVYIGKTKRNISIRSKEHFRNIKYKHLENSAVAQHFWIDKHKMSKNAKLLKHASNYKELTVWEKIFILKNRDKILNFEIPSENDLIGGIG